MEGERRGGEEERRKVKGKGKGKKKGEERGEREERKERRERREDGRGEKRKGCVYLFFLAIAHSQLSVLHRSLSSVHLEDTDVQGHLISHPYCSISMISNFMSVI